MSKEAMKLALEGAANYIDALGGDSRKYRQALASEAKEQPAPGRAHYEDGDVFERIAAIKKQPAQQEPVAKDNSNYRVDPPGLDPRYTPPPAQRQRSVKPLTDEMVVAAARVLSDRQAALCNVDCGDMWKIHGNDFLEDARAALEAAHGIKE